jgi:hypothetical protein
VNAWFRPHLFEHAHHQSRAKQQLRIAGFRDVPRGHFSKRSVKRAGQAEVPIGMNVEKQVALANPAEADPIAEAESIHRICSAAMARGAWPRATPFSRW